MPRKVKTRRQRKRATVKKNVAKEEQTSHPGEKAGNLESRVIIDENLAKHINRPPLVAPSEEEKEVAMTSSDKLVKKKAAHKRGRNPKGTQSVGELGNALDKDEEQYSSSKSVGTINENKLLDQIWNDLDEVFPSSDEDVTKGGLSRNVDWVKQPASLKSSYKLVKMKAAYHRRLTSRGTGNAWKLENGVDKEKEQNCTSDLLDIHADGLEQLLKELQEIFPPSDGAVAKGGLSPDVEWENQSGNIEGCNTLVSPSEEEEDKAIISQNLMKKKAPHQRGGTTERTGNVCELGIALDTDEEQYSTSNLLGIIDEAELDQIWKDLHEIFPSTDKAAPQGGLSPEVEWEKKSDHLESSVIIDSHLANGPPLVSPSEEEKDKPVTSTDQLVKKKAAHHRNRTSKGTRKACELGNGYPSHFQEQNSTSDLLGTIDKAELDQIWKDLHEIFPSSDKAVPKGGLSPEVEWGKKSDHLESSVIIDSHLANGPPLVSPSKEEKDKSVTTTDKLVKKKAVHHRNGTSKRTRKACKLGNGCPSHFQEQNSTSDLLVTIDKAELDQIWKDLEEIYPIGDETECGLYPKMDWSTPGRLVEDSGPVPPKFFGNSGYFMLTGTNSQLQLQMKDLAAKNIFVESFVELPDAMADIVEQQMTDLVQNRDPILGTMRDKYDLLEPRRVPRRKKQRKYPKKTNN